MEALGIIQNIVYNELIKNDVLKNITYDEVPSKKQLEESKKPRFPYISIGEAEEDENDGFGESSKVWHTVDIFDNTKGNKNTLNYIKIITKILKENCNKQEYFYEDDGYNYQVMFEAIEKKRIEKLIDEPSDVMVRHGLVIARFTVIKL